MKPYTVEEMINILSNYPKDTVVTTFANFNIHNIVTHQFCEETNSVEFGCEIADEDD